MQAFERTFNQSQTRKLKPVVFHVWTHSPPEPPMWINVLHVPLVPSSVLTVKGFFVIQLVQEEEMFQITPEWIRFIEGYPKIPIALSTCTSVHLILLSYKLFPKLFPLVTAQKKRQKGAGGRVKRIQIKFDKNKPQESIYRLRAVSYFTLQSYCMRNPSTRAAKQGAGINKGVSLWRKNKTSFLVSS